MVFRFTWGQRQGDHELPVDDVLKAGTKTGKEGWLSLAVSICTRH